MPDPARPVPTAADRAGRIDLLPVLTPAGLVEFRVVPAASTSPAPAPPAIVVPAPALDAAARDRLRTAGGRLAAAAVDAGAIRRRPRRGRRP